VHPINQNIAVAPAPRATPSAATTAPGETCGVPCAVWAAAGVYLPSFDADHHGHELTQKIRSSKASRSHDREFADLLAAILATSLRGFSPALVISVPHRPREEDRFRHIRRLLASQTEAADGEAALRQSRVVEGYRQMTADQRRACCAGRFSARRCVRGKDVLLIDDVITSGAQAAEAIRALRAAGAATVAFLAIARATRPPEALVGRGGPEAGSGVS